MAADTEQSQGRTTWSRRDLMHWAGVGGGAAAVSGLLAACTGSSGASASSGGGGVGSFPKTPKWNFVFVNHVTTNPFFVPTKYGIQDAASIFNLGHQWTGSEKSKASEMVNAMNAAISSGADGIAVSLVDPTAFIEPTKKALKKGIPVIAYNANSTKTPALTYVGQDLYKSGQAMGRRIVKEVGSGDVAIFIATPGQLNIQPRSDGARDAIKASGKNIRVHQVATGAKVADELSAVESFYIGHKGFKGLYAVDAGSTEAVAQIMNKYDLRSKGVHGGGFDLLPKTVSLIDKNKMDFTINQEPYMQGFLPMLYLYMFKISGTILAPPRTNTGLDFLTPKTIKPFASEQSRYEGDTDKQTVLKHSGPIPIPATTS